MEVGVAIAAAGEAGAAGGRLHPEHEDPELGPRQSRNEPLHEDSHRVPVQVTRQEPNPDRFPRRPLPMARLLRRLRRLRRPTQPG